MDRDGSRLAGTTVAAVVAALLLVGCGRTTGVVLLDTPALKVSRTDRDDFDIMSSRWDTYTTFSIFLNGKELAEEDYSQLFYQREADKDAAYPRYVPTDVVVLDRYSLLLRTRYSSPVAYDARIGRLLVENGQPKVEPLADGIGAELGFFSTGRENWIGIHGNGGGFVLARKSPYKLHPLSGRYLAQPSDAVVIVLDEASNNQNNVGAYAIRALDIQTAEQLAEYRLDHDVRLLPGQTEGWFRDNFRFESTPRPAIELRAGRTLR